MASHVTPSSSYIPLSRAYERGKFGRLFPWLPPSQNYRNRKDLNDLAKSMLSRPVSSGAIPAGYTYLGQFLIHDISFDPTSINERQVDPEYLWNFRTPALDLDSIYGGGPTVTPYLYDHSKNSGKTHFLIRKVNKRGFGFYDLPRLDNGMKEVAVIADPRNDEHIIISQLHTAFLILHNKFADKWSKEIENKDEIFRLAQKETRWHFQWVILYDYLPRIVDLKVFNLAPIKRIGRFIEPELAKVFRMQELLESKDIRRFYDWRNEPFIPLEFSAAAFRFGHTQVLSHYKFNKHFPHAPLFSISEFNRVFTFVDWSLFFPKRRNPLINLAAEIKPRIGIFLSDLPIPGTNPSEVIDIEYLQKMIDDGSQIYEITAKLCDMKINERNLAERNLFRGLMLRLPSGQNIAKAMRVDYISEVKGIPETMKENTPLWYYILKEADHFNNGAFLGPVASRIITEVIIGLIQGDKSSFLNQDPDWKPEKLKNNPNEAYLMADLLDDAGIYNGAR